MQESFKNASSAYVRYIAAGGRRDRAARNNARAGRAEIFCFIPRACRKLFGEKKLYARKDEIIK